MTNVSLTSLHAHTEQIVSGRAQSQRERILDCLKNSTVPLTRRQLSELTRIPINAVCGRVSTLLASDLVRIAYEDEDQGTGTSAQFLEPVRPQPVQRSFPWPKPS